jgi:exopolysaccharide biosynthesis polyprenyl glycosylphosphotransferase
VALDLGIGARSGGAVGGVGGGGDVALRGVGLPRRVVARRRSRRDSAVRRLLLVSDATAVLLGLAISTLALSNHPGEFAWGVASLPLWIVVFKAYGLYDRDTKRISHGTIEDLPWLFHAMVVGTLLLLALFRLTPSGGIELSDLATFAVLAMIAAVALRVLARRAGTRLLGPERVLLVGEGPQVGTLARKLTAHPEYGVEPVGLVTRSAVSPEIAGGIAYWGTLDELDLDAVVERYRVERLVAAHEDYDDGRLFGLLCRCRELGVKLSILPQLFDALGPSVELDDVEGITVLGVTPPVLPRSSRFLKRTMDVAGASLLLLLAAPVIVLAAIAIKLDSPGPVLFRQRRIGRDGSRFMLLKCRTMCADAERRRQELLAKSKDPGWLLLDHDPRITGVGRFLRRTSIDELPQLWNVLRGEMSLVGPRPIVEDEDRQLEGWRRARIDLTPGITGLWQVLGRTNIPFEEMIKLDYLYVTNWSLWTDVSLMLRTLPAVLTRRGVN